MAVLPVPLISHRHLPAISVQSHSCNKRSVSSHLSKIAIMSTNWTTLQDLTLFNSVSARSQTFKQNIRSINRSARKSRRPRMLSLTSPMTAMIHRLRGPSVNLKVPCNWSAGTVTLTLQYRYTLEKTSTPILKMWSTVPVGSCVIAASAAVPHPTVTRHSMEMTATQIQTAQQHSGADLRRKRYWLSNILFKMTVENWSRCKTEWRSLHRSNSSPVVRALWCSRKVRRSLSWRVRSSNHGRVQDRIADSAHGHRTAELAWWPGHERAELA